MAPKRHLGLGKAAKAKKQKKEESEGPEQPQQQSNEITVELNEEADANDELSQLRALWRTHAKSDKDNELVVNGIIHECDRLLRNSNLAQGEDEQNKSKDTEQGLPELPADFHSIYALALADLAFFHAGDASKVKEFFDAALERVELGLESNSGSIELLFTKSRILINQIPLQYLSQMTIESKVDESNPKIAKKLDQALKIYEEAEDQAETLGQYELFNEDNLEILQAFDDLLEIVDNFGKDNLEGDESDKEDGGDDEDDVELSKKHPLYGIKETDKYNEWWRVHTIKFLHNVDQQLEKIGISYKVNHENENSLLPLRRELCKRIGQSYLQEAEIPSSVFTTLKYDDGFADVKELEGLSQEDAQKISQDLFKTALDYLKMAEDKEEPDSWVNIAECMISLGNLYEIDSKEQEQFYIDAEKILVRANNATNGKYEDILENLQN